MKQKTIKIVYALLGILLIGIGIAFNAATHFGNDPIGILYDGVRHIANLSDSQLGHAVNVVNVLLTVFVFILGRKYVNIGTFIYILPYGLFVNLGSWIYNQFLDSNLLLIRIMTVTIGCLFIFTGVAIYIWVEIGLDPITGVTMVIRDKLNWSFRWTKIMFDIVATLIGFLLGGKIGTITIITAIVGGPIIQFILSILQGKYKKKDMA